MLSLKQRELLKDGGQYLISGDRLKLTCGVFIDRELQKYQIVPCEIPEWDR